MKVFLKIDLESDAPVIMATLHVSCDDPECGCGLKEEKAVMISALPEQIAEQCPGAFEIWKEAVTKIVKEFVEAVPGIQVKAIHEFTRADLN